jgi:hypothetical protein
VGCGRCRLKLVVVVVVVTVLGRWMNGWERVARACILQVETDMRTSARRLQHARSPGSMAIRVQPNKQSTERTNERTEEPSGPQTKTRGTTDIDSSIHDTAPTRPNIQDTHFHSGSGIKLHLPIPSIRTPTLRKRSTQKKRPDSYTTIAMWVSYALARQPSQISKHTRPQTQNRTQTKESRACPRESLDKIDAIEEKKRAGQRKDRKKEKRTKKKKKKKKKNLPAHHEQKLNRAINAQPVSTVRPLERIARLIGREAHLDDAVNGLVGRVLVHGAV